MRKYLFILAMAFITSAFSQTLESKVSAKLNEAIAESSASSGSVAVIERSTGKLVVSIGNIDKAQPTKLFTPFALLACLESNRLQLTDEIDAGNGIYINGTDTIKDHNYRLGGYGVISVLDGFTHYSDITTLKAIGKAFKQTADYQKQLEAIGITGISNIDNLRYNASLLQILTLYNAVANNSIKANADNVVAIKKALRSNVNDGMGKQLVSNKTEIAAYSRTIRLEDGSYKSDICGYTPQYTIIVSIEQKDRPQQPNISNKLFCDITDLLTK